MINTEYFREGTPLYAFLVSGDLNQQAEYNIFYDSIIANIIEEHGGGLLAVETRYYGDSRPFLNYSLDNLAPLSIDTILMDFNRIIIDEFLIPKTFDFPIIVLGEGIAATYATFFHATYSLSSSVIAFGAVTRAQTDFGEYLIDIERSLNNFGRYEHVECVQIIKNGLVELLNYFSNQDLNAIKSIFNLKVSSFDISNPKDHTLLFEDVVVNYIAAAFTLYEANNFNDFCAPILSATGSDLKRLVERYYPSREINYNKFVNSLQNEEGWFTDVLSIPMSSRQRFYQHCTELNWFRTTTKIPNPSSKLIPIEFYYELCADVFGSQFTPEFIASNHNSSISFHANRIAERAIDSIFVYGELDPYRLTGVTEAHESSSVYHFSNYGNTQGLRRENEDDTNEIKLLKKYLRLHLLSFYL